jgi:hypothetical protein
MPSLRTYWLAITATLLLAFLVRLAAAVWWQQRVESPDGFASVEGDAFSYWNLGRSIAEGKPYSYAYSRVFRVPGYPLVLSLLFTIRNPPPVLWARALGAVFGTAAVGGVIALGHQLFGPRCAVIAGIMAAFYPGAIGMSVLVLSEALFCPFMLLHLLCWVAAERADRSCIAWGLAVAGGCAAGAANLIRPSWLLFTPVAACLGVLCGPNRARHVFVAAIMLASTAATMTPWWIRNYHVTGAFVPTSLEIGASLYDSWNPNATGGSNMHFVDDFRAELLRAEPGSQTSAEVFEIRLDRTMRDAAVSWARAHPRRVLQLAGEKFWRMWGPWPNSPDIGGSAFRWIIAVGYCPLLLAGLWGVIKYRSSGWRYWLCVLPAVYFTLLHVIFVSSIRYRQPAMLPWIVLGAGAVAAWVWRADHAVASER